MIKMKRIMVTIPDNKESENAVKAMCLKLRAEYKIKVLTGGKDED